MNKKTKLMSLSIILASTPLLGAIYVANIEYFAHPFGDYINIAENNKIGNEHITFPQNGGYYIQNSSPLNDYRIANYSIEFKISAQDTNWAGVEVKTSNYYNEELAGYNNGITCTLNAWDNKFSSKTYNFTILEPYFSISYAGGSDIALDYLTISYSC